MNNGQSNIVVSVEGTMKLTKGGKELLTGMVEDASLQDIMIVERRYLLFNRIFSATVGITSIRPAGDGQTSMGAQTVYPPTVRWEFRPWVWICGLARRDEQ